MRQSDLLCESESHMVGIFQMCGDVSQNTRMANTLIIDKLNGSLVLHAIKSSKTRCQTLPAMQLF